MSFVFFTKMFCGLCAVKLMSVLVFALMTDRPEKPENLSCVAVQERKLISSNIRCTWEPGTRESKELNTKYTLSVKKQL